MLTALSTPEESWVFSHDVNRFCFSLPPDRLFGPGLWCRSLLHALDFSITSDSYRFCCKLYLVTQKILYFLFLFNGSNAQEDNTSERIAVWRLSLLTTELPFSEQRLADSFLHTKQPGFHLPFDTGRTRVNLLTVRFAGRKLPLLWLKGAFFFSVLTHSVLGICNSPVTLPLKWNLTSFLFVSCTMVTLFSPWGTKMPCLVG